MQSAACSIHEGPAHGTQVADLRERIQIDEWDTAAWQALVACVCDAAERSPNPQQLEEQRLVYNDFLARFPTAVSLDTLQHAAPCRMHYQSAGWSVLHSAACELLILAGNPGSQA